MITFKELEKRVKEAQAEASVTHRRVSIGCGGGITLTVSAKSLKYVVRVPTEDGKRTNRVIGNYGRISLARAREMASEIISEANQKIAQVKHAQKEKEARQDTGGMYLGEFLDRQLEDIRTRGRNDKRFLNVRPLRKALAALDNVSLNAVTADQVVQIIRKMNASESKKFLTAAFIKQMLTEAVMLGLLSSNPCLYVTKIIKRPAKVGFASVRAEELRARFFEPLEDAPDFLKLFYMYLAFSCVRLSEARLMLWQWIDYGNGVISIPASNMKMNRPFNVPLTPQIKAVLESMRIHFGSVSPYVFYHWSLRHYSINVSEAMPERHLQSPITACCGGLCTMHGLRKSARTWMAENGVSYEVAEMCLSHVEKSTVARAYIKTDYIEERRKVLTQWDEYVFSILPESFKTLLAKDLRQ